MPQTKNGDIDVESLIQCPPAHAGPAEAECQRLIPTWPSKVSKRFFKLLVYIAWVVLGTAVGLFISVIVIDLRLATPSLPDSTAFVQLGTPQSFALREYSESNTMTHSASSRHILRRYHNWNDCPDWPETEKCKQEICNIDFRAACHNKTDLWKCKMCFSDQGEINRTDETLAERCCQAKRKAEVVWISICSTVGLLLLLALGGCMFKQARETRRARERDRAIRLQDRELGAAFKPHVDGADDTVRWAKPARRVPVLPISRSRTSSAGNTLDPSRIRARQSSAGSLGIGGTGAGPSSIATPH